MHEGDSSSCIVKKEKIKNKNKISSQKESIHLNEVSFSSNGPYCHEKNTTEEQAKLDTALTEIEILKNEEETGANM